MLRDPHCTGAHPERGRGLLDGSGLLLGPLGKVVGCGAHFVRAGVDGIGILPDRSQGRLQLADGLVEILAKAVEMGGKGRHDLVGDITVRQVGKAGSKRIDSVLDLGSLAGLLRLTLPALALGQAATVLRLLFKTDALESVIPEDGDGSGHLAHLVAALHAGNRFLGLSCRKRYHPRPQRRDRRGDAARGDEEGTGHARDDRDAESKERVEDRCGGSGAQLIAPGRDALGQLCAPDPHFVAKHANGIVRGDIARHCRCKLTLLRKRYGLVRDDKNLVEALLERVQLLGGRGQERPDLAEPLLHGFPRALVAPDDLAIGHGRGVGRRGDIRLVGGGIDAATQVVHACNRGIVPRYELRIEIVGFLELHSHDRHARDRNGAYADEGRENLRSDPGIRKKGHTRLHG